MNKQEFDQFAKNYNEILSNSFLLNVSSDSYFAEYKVALTKTHLKKNEPKSILDFGCGTGRSLPFFEQFFPNSKICGYDPSLESLAIAKTNSPNSIFFSNLDELEEESFDLVFIANVLHHIPPGDQIFILEKLKKIISSQGFIFIFEHNPYNPITKWVFERCPFDLNAKMIRKKLLKELVLNIDLNLIDEGYTLFFPNILSGLRYLERYLVNLPLGAQYFLKLSKDS